MSERRACRAIGQARSSQRYQPQPDVDEPRLIQEMLALVRQHPRYGYRMVCSMLRRSGWKVNRKRIYRLWVQEGLKVPKKQRKKRRLGTSENGCVRHRAEHKDHVWAWDFVHDRTVKGRPLKWLSIVDEYTRECLALDVNHRMKAEDVLDVLAELFVLRGIPRHIRSDNGPEFVAQTIRRWLKQAGVATLYIEPGSPWENAYAESFHSRFRDEVLNRELFTHLAEAKALSTAWRLEYNHRRPHSSLGYQTPAEFAAGCAAASAPAAPPLQQQHSRNPEVPTQPTLS